MDCSIRALRLDEIQLVIDWAAEEGWNPGLHDARSFYAADPEGFLVAEVGGEPVGCVSAVTYGSDFGFVGLYIVTPDWRGHGIGLRLWNAAISRLSGRTIGLDGVPAQQDNYRRSGFTLAWRNARYAGVARPCEKAALTELVPLSTVDFEALCHKDLETFPAPRVAFLREWCSVPDSAGLAWLHNDRIGGWGVIRRCREGHKIGPLVADEPAIASALYAGLCSMVPPGDAVYLDVPEPNASSVTLAQSNGMRSVFQTARMYKGPAPQCNLGAIYGITTFELG